MSFYQNHPRHRPFEAALAPFLQADDLPFAGILPAQDVQQAFDDAGIHFGDTSRSVYNPALTLWAFLSQVLSANKSCRAAVLRVIVVLVALGRRPCAVDTGAYCRARAQFPVVVLRRLAVQVGRQLEDAVPATWLWKNRHVQLVDGFTVSLPDTPANQKAYPQARTQKPGVGFPIMRLVIIVSLATAAVQDLAMGPYKGKETGESALLRQMLLDMRPGSVVLADRYYCSYFMIALLQRQGMDVVSRMHQFRTVDFRRGRRLGADDHIVKWVRPVRPDWMDQETYDAMPKTLTVREVRTAVNRPGYRIKELVVVTTLIDEQSYAAEELTDLYHERWHAELDIRSLKQYLGMDVLRCLTPEMVAKEIWVHVLGYNLVRKVTAQAAAAKGLSPRGMSFTASLQAVRAAWDRLTTASSAQGSVLGQALLQGLGTETVGDRPDRCEPRALKRRPKPHPLLNQPRAEARAALLRG
jgi:hypothetical protein